MGEAMKYKIRDESFAKLISLLFDEQDVQNQIERQINDICTDFRFTNEVTNPDQTKLRPEFDDLKNRDIEVIVIFSKKEVEKIPEYEPDKWNLYPEIKPPKEGRYLIQWGNGNDEPFFSIRTWEEENPWRGNFVFRELPEPYLGEDLKEEVKAEEIF